MNLSRPEAVEYLQRATGLDLTPTPVPLNVPGHYAIFIGEEHVIYGRVHHTGKIFLLDPQSNTRLVIDELPAYAKGNPIRPYRFE